MPASAPSVAAWAVGMAFALFAAASARLIVVDLREHRLPNRLLAWSSGLVGGLLVLAASLGGEWGRLGSAILAAAVYGVAMLGLRLLGRGALGAGDVKLAPLVGAVSAWVDPWAAMLWTPLLIAVIGTVAGAVARRRRRVELAFGPVMLAGCWLGLGLGVMPG